MMEYGCIGERLTHSFSKEIHAQLFDYSYELKEIPQAALDGFMRAHDFRAINVTIPYKQAVIPYLDEISETARTIGAVNTIVNRNGRLYGYNTDFLGMTALIEKNKIEIAGKKVLVLGSGGTSKTALAVAESLGAKETYRVSRSGRDGCITYEAAAQTHPDASVIINTTPCGMYPNPGTAAISLEDFPAVTGVIDAIYNPLRPELVIAAQKKGIPASGGLYMLVSQAVFAAEKFTDTKIPPEKTEEVFRKIFRSKENIVLVGMPGSGKTTIGKRLSSLLSMGFVDTDEEIVKREKRTIPEIFSAVGETGFREIEAAVVKEICALQHTVIATGGGAVLRERNTDLLRENGKIYFLDRPLEQLVMTDDRPLSSDIEKLKKRYTERYGIYLACADRVIKCTGDIAENVAAVKDDFTK